MQCDWADIDGQRRPGVRIALTDAELGTDIPPYGVEKGENAMLMWLRRLLDRLGLLPKQDVHYIGGSDTLPRP